MALENSDLCCAIQKVASIPVGYADDPATASVPKMKADRALQVVHDFGTKWRFEFNGRNSAILVYWERRKEHERMSKDGMFMLGSERVMEKCEYGIHPSNAEVTFIQSTRTRPFFENYLNPVMLVLIR